LYFGIQNSQKLVLIVPPAFSSTLKKEMPISDMHPFHKILWPSFLAVLVSICSRNFIDDYFTSWMDSIQILMESPTHENIPS
jgi:hypothetical protein